MDTTGVLPIVDEIATAPVVVAKGDDTRPLATDLRLVCVAGEDIGRTFRIDERSMTIGRGAVAIALGSTSVSRNHARITATGGDLTITDLGSSNGTLVNAVRIAKPTPLQIGDRVQVGSTILLVSRYDELEERMRRIQRLEAMGTLAGGLAHDFNNALQIIVMNLDVVRDRVGESRELVEMVDEMMAAASSATALARRLLRLGRSEPIAFEPVPLGDVVTRALSPLRRDGRLEIDARVPNLVVRGSPDEIYQLLVNLFVNARDAMPDGGKLIVTAAEQRLDLAAAHAKQLPGDGRYAAIAVTDTGTGMDEATLAHVFDPFFTTKPAGSGTGLGLTMVHGIVRRHGGAITVTSAKGSGTTFTVHLPLSAQP